MWAWQSGWCQRYLAGEHTSQCTHYHLPGAACVAQGDHRGWLSNNDAGWLCEAHGGRSRLRVRDEMNAKGGSCCYDRGQPPVVREGQGGS